LDGKYSNTPLGDNIGGDKIETRRKEIIKFLRKNPNSYWLNTFSFEKLIFDLK